MSSSHVREALGAYVLGALEPEEHEAVAAHLARCRDCAAEHARLAGLPALLRPAEGLEIPAAPAAVEERLLDRLARERGARARSRHAAGGVLALLGFGEGARRFARMRATVAAAAAGIAVGVGVSALADRDEGAPPAPASYALQLTGGTGASARAELKPGRGGTEVHMWVKGLPPGAEAVYEVRCERSGWSASAGTFRADSRGRAYVVLTTAARMGEYERIRVVRRDNPRDADVMAGVIQ